VTGLVTGGKPFRKPVLTRLIDLGENHFGKPLGNPSRENPLIPGKTFSGNPLLCFSGKSYRFNVFTHFWACRVAMPLLLQNHCALFGLIPSLGISLPCERSRSLLGLMPCLCYSSLRPRVGCGYLASKEPRLALFGFHFLTAVFTVSRCGVHALHRLFSLAVVVPFSGFTVVVTVSGSVEIKLNTVFLAFTVVFAISGYDSCFCSWF
jgi:hypothetical protein